MLRWKRSKDASKTKIRSSRSPSSKNSELWWRSKRKLPRIALKSVTSSARRWKATCSMIRFNEQEHRSASVTQQGSSACKDITQQTSMAWLRWEQGVKASLEAERTTSPPLSTLVKMMKSRTISILGWRRTRRNWRGPPTWKIREWRSLCRRCRAKPRSMAAQRYQERPSGMSGTRSTGWNSLNRTRWDVMRWKSARRKRIEKTWNSFFSRRKSVGKRKGHSFLVWMTTSMLTRRRRMQSWRSGAMPRTAHSAVRVWYRWRKICWIGQRWPFAASKSSRWTCRGWNSIRVNTNRCSQAPSLRKISAQICSSNAKPKPLSKPSASSKAYRTNSTALRPILNSWSLQFPWISTRRSSTLSKSLSQRPKLIEEFLG